MENDDSNQDRTSERASTTTNPTNQFEEEDDDDDDDNSNNNNNVGWFTGTCEASRLPPQNDNIDVDDDKDDTLSRNIHLDHDDVVMTENHHHHRNIPHRTTGTETTTMTTTTTTDTMSLPSTTTTTNAAVTLPRHNLFQLTALSSQLQQSGPSNDTAGSATTTTDHHIAVSEPEGMTMRDITTAARTHNTTSTDGAASTTTTTTTTTTQQQQINKESDSGLNHFVRSPEQVPVPQQTELEERFQQRYQRLKRICRKYNHRPSFMKLLRTNLDVSDDENENDNNNHHHATENLGHSSSNTTTITLEQLPKRLKVDLDTSWIPLLDPQPMHHGNNHRTIINQHYHHHHPEGSRTPTSVLLLLGTDSSSGGGSPMNFNDHTLTTDHHHPRMMAKNTVPNTSFRLPHSLSSETNGLPSIEEEGWYEGVAMWYLLPEDMEYLTPLQQYIRQQIQLFSHVGSRSHSSNSTGSHTTTNRMMIERGRVGVRCIHCTKAYRVIGSDMIGRMTPYHPTTDYTATTTMTSSSSSSSLPIASAFYYPNSIAHLSSTYMSKFQSHLLKTCPNIPDELKIQLLTLLEENNNSNNKATACGGNEESKGNSSGGNPNELSAGPLSHTMYNVITARRIGLVDVSTDRGIRFSRDLQRQPLPFTNVRYRVEHETNMGTTMVNTEDNPTASGGTPMNHTTTTRITVEGRMIADEESEMVMAEAVTERNDDDPDDENRLCRVEEKAMLSDYIFLVMRQMSLCRATTTDLTAKWKKHKRLQIGYAGFCCRWCYPTSNGNPTNSDVLSTSSQPSSPLVPKEKSSARFFPSAPDHLTSAVGSSFVVHLQKCKYIPSRLHHALATYKKLHGYHMTQLPYGSQRRMYQLLWSRLRAADRIEMGMIDSATPSNSLMVDDDEDVVEIEPESPMETPHDDTLEAASESETDALHLDSNEETQVILQDSVTNWDISTNDGLILPEDRSLVSDYLFLMMRQIRKVQMDDTDQIRIRKMIRPNIFGLACIHCFHREIPGVSPSGRAFPSAPDNFHAALNTSLFNHMQVCLHVSSRLKQALVDTRKYHSTQCASLKFGSQRKFFNILFGRLAIDESMSGGVVEGKDNTETEPLVLSQYGFLQMAMSDPTKTMTMCQYCRMVPLPFRSPYSYCIGPISPDQIQDHYRTCYKSSLDLTAIVNALDEIIRVDFGNNVQVLKRTSFDDVMRAVLVDETLVTIFTKNVVQLVFQKRGLASINSDDNGTEDPNQSIVQPTPPNNAWQLFPTTVDVDAFSAAWKTFTNEMGHVSSSSTDRFDPNCPNFLQYLLMISPGLPVPIES